MAATAETSPNRHININSTGGDNDWLQIVSDVADTTYIETLENDSGTVIILVKEQIRIDNDAVVEDDGVIILHTLNSSNDAIIFNGAGGGRFTFGVNNPFTETGASDDEPVTSNRSGTDANHISPCCYSFVSNNASQTWTDGGAGSWYMHGGMMMFRDNAPDADNDLYEINFPEDMRIIQCNVEKWGGGTIHGAGTRIQESTLKSSANEPLKFDVAVTGRLQDIIFHAMNPAIDLEATAFNNTLRRIQFRKSSGDDITYSGYTGDFELIDSDNVDVQAGSTIGVGGTVIEKTSYTFDIVDENGAAVTDARVVAFNVGDGTAYGSSQITTYSEFLADRNIRNNANPITPVVAGNFGVRVRRYASLHQTNIRVPGEKGIVETIVVIADPFTVLSEGAAAALSGVAIDDSNNEIDLTATRTASELYDKLKAELDDDDAAMDVPDLFTTTDGNSYTMPSDWTLTGQQNLDLSDGSFIINRYVPVTITGLVQNAECAVVDVVTNTVLGSGEVAAAQTSITLTTTFTSNQVSIRARLAGRKPFRTDITLGSTGNTVDATSQFVVDNEFN